MAGLMGPLVIIPCGQAKLTHPAPAGELYVGAYATSCRRWALRVTEPERVRVLSALYGLVPLDRVLRPYDLRMGRPGSVEPEYLIRQAARQHLLGEPVVLAVGGRAYLEAARAVWPHLRAPFKGMAMGHQRAAMARWSGASRPSL
jgi:hypothetical protein